MQKLDAEIVQDALALNKTLTMRPISALAASSFWTAFPLWAWALIIYPAVSVFISHAQCLYSYYDTIRVVRGQLARAEDRNLPHHVGRPS